MSDKYKDIISRGGGFLVFDYDAKIKGADGTTTTERRKALIELGTVTKFTDSLTKSSVSSINIVSMGQRYNYFIDSGNSRTISVDFTRITPRCPTRGEGFPAMKDGDGVFCWEMDDKLVVRDLGVVDADTEFAGNCVDEENKPSATLSKYWTNAYWIKAVEKAIDRWQLKYNGCTLYYSPTDEDLSSYISEDDIKHDGNILPSLIAYQGYIGNITYSFKAGEVEALSVTISLSVGRRIRQVKYSA